MQDHAQNNNKNCFFLNCNRYQKNLLQSSHKTSHRLCVSSGGGGGGGFSEVHFKKRMNSLLWRAGKLILPKPSACTKQKTGALGILNLPQQLTIKEYLCIKFLTTIAKTTWHNSLLVTSPTILIPGITSRCKDQGLTCLKTSIIYPGTPCLIIWNPVFLFLVSNVTYTNIFLRITFHQTWMDLFGSYVCLKWVLYTCMFINKI